MRLRITQRKDNEIVTAFEIQCLSCSKHLITQVIDQTGKLVAEYKSER